jgi:hypothetical protein
MMKTPVLMAVGLYLAGGARQFLSVGAAMLLGALLWGALYTLNESTDLELEEGLVVEPSIYTAIGLVALTACSLAAVLSLPLGRLFAFMALGQLAYCVPPLRLKRWWWAVLLISGVANPILRVQCGVVWGAHAAPLIVYPVLIMAHLGPAIRTRTLQRERDRSLGYQVAPETIGRWGKALTAAAWIGTCLLCITGVLPRPFLIFVVPSGGFGLYAWSDRVSSIGRLRQGWLLFALMALSAVAVLLRGR